MKRRSFIQQTTLAGAGLLLGNKYGFAGTNEPLQFPVVPRQIKGILPVKQ